MITVSERAALQRAISPDRLSTYTAAATTRNCDSLDLYVWDRDLAAATIADVAVLEIAMRNAMSRCLERRAGQPDWYVVDIGLDNRSLASISKVWSDLPATHRTPGRIVSHLMFGFWRSLLDAGGTTGKAPLVNKADYETLWRSTTHHAFPGGRLQAAAQQQRFTRTWTLDVVKVVHALRNRAAHHEPLVNGFAIPGENRRVSTAHGHAACLQLARLLDRDLASWLTRESRMRSMLATSP